MTTAPTDAWYITTQCATSRRTGTLKYGYTFNRAGYWPIPDGLRYKTEEAARRAGEKALIEGGWNLPAGGEQP